MSDFEIECLECGWQGKKPDLVSVDDDAKEGMYCPDCGSKDIKDLKQ
jgi:DNA-directed RNA polymerase subunit RPC12/RpoP